MQVRAAITSIDIDNVRSSRKLRVECLVPVNLIVGRTTPSRTDGADMTA
jgi:hypothetical protein